MVATHLNGTRMPIAPPPSPGPRIQELAETLVVTFRPRRPWGELLFLGFWLTFWTFGGIAALLSLAGADWGGRVFLLFWLCGWAVGEAFAASWIAWKLAGREFLSLTPNQLEVRKQVGRFASTRRLHALSIEDVQAERVPTDEDEQPRTDYRLRIVSRDETLHVGEGMSEHEAEDVVSVVRSHLDPRPRWSDDPSEYGFASTVDPGPAIPDPTRARRDSPARELDWGRVLARVAPALIGAILIALVVTVVLPPLRHPPQPPRLVPPPATRVEPPPAPADLTRPAGSAPGIRRPARLRDRDDALLARGPGDETRIRASVREDGHVDALDLPRTRQVANRAVRRAFTPLSVLDGIRATARCTARPRDPLRPQAPTADHALRRRRRDCKHALILVSPDGTRYPPSGHTAVGDRLDVGVYLCGDRLRPNRSDSDLSSTSAGVCPQHDCARHRNLRRRHRESKLPNHNPTTLPEPAWRADFSRDPTPSKLALLADGSFGDG
jgi:hypothetical protein